MRTNKKERKENANEFYNSFIGGNCKNAAIVVKRFDNSSNPNINRCQFVSAFMGKVKMRNVSLYMSSSHLQESTNCT